MFSFVSAFSSGFLIESSRGQFFFALSFACSHLAAFFPFPPPPPAAKCQRHILLLAHCWWMALASKPKTNSMGSLHHERALYLLLLASLLRIALCLSSSLLAVVLSIVPENWLQFSAHTRTHNCHKIHCNVNTHTHNHWANFASKNEPLKTRRSFFENALHDTKFKSFKNFATFLCAGSKKFLQLVFSLRARAQSK